MQREDFAKLKISLRKSETVALLHHDALFVTDVKRGFVVSGIQQVNDISHQYDRSYPVAISVDGIVGHIDPLEFPMIEIVCESVRETFMKKQPHGTMWPL
jgi:hypothetical protein